MCERRKFIMAILHGKQGLLCDKSAKLHKGFVCELFTTQSRLLTPLKKKFLENIVGKRRKCWLLFPILLSANALNLD